ncbi:unnamed protein product [Closterium sp. NIES-64]|nr:unnamed protein product [Closterium sp. NIES-64]
MLWFSVKGAGRGEELSCDALSACVYGRSAGEEREERWRGERGALCEEREERWRGERGALARRERSAGEEREERWRGERGALARRERSAGEEREERWRGERGALARRERSAGEESEERWRGEERWHGEGVLGGECVRKVSFCFPLPCARHFLVMKTFLLALSSCMARTASSSLLPPVRDWDGGPLASGLALHGCERGSGPSASGGTGAAAVRGLQGDAAAGVHMGTGGQAFQG